MLLPYWCLVLVLSVNITDSYQHLVSSKNAGLPLQDHHHCPQVALGASILSNSLPWNQTEVWQHCWAKAVSGLHSKPQSCSTKPSHHHSRLTITVSPSPSQNHHFNHYHSNHSKVRVAIAISGSYFLFHLLYFLLLTIRLAQAAGKDAERWNLLLGKKTFSPRKTPMDSLSNVCLCRSWLVYACVHHHWQW